MHETETKTNKGIKLLKTFLNSLDKKNNILETDLKIKDLLVTKFKAEIEKLTLIIIQQEVELTKQLSDPFSAYRLQMNSLQDCILKLKNDNTKSADQKEDNQVLITQDK